MNAHGTPVLKLAPPYDDDLIRRIEQGFSDKLGFDVQFEVIEDSSLWCGFIAYVAGTVYDVSGKTQMDAIKEHLLDLLVIPPPAESEEDDDEEDDVL